MFKKSQFKEGHKGLCVFHSWWPLFRQWVANIFRRRTFHLGHNPLPAVDEASLFPPVNDAIGCVQPEHACNEGDANCPLPSLSHEPPLPIDPEISLSLCEQIDAPDSVPAVDNNVVLDDIVDDFIDIVRYYDQFAATMQGQDSVRDLIMDFTSKIVDVLIKDCGCTAIENEGEPFDILRHCAFPAQLVANGVPIVRVIRKGLLRKDRVRLVALVALDNNVE